MKNILVLICCCTIISLSSRASSFLCYDVADPVLNITQFQLGQFTDLSSELSVEAIAQQTDSFSLATSWFKLSDQANNEFSKILNCANFWFTFSITNTSERYIDRVIAIDEAYLESVDLYFRTDNGWFCKPNGVNHPPCHREIKSRCPSFLISLAPNETKKLYIKVHSEFIDSFRFLIQSPLVFAKHQEHSAIGYWLYLGLALGMLVYNLFVMVYMYRRAHLYYVLALTNFIVFILLYSGYWLYAFHGNQLYHAMHASMALIGMFTTLFSRELLDVKHLSKWIDKALQAISAIFLVMAMLIIVAPYNYRWAVLFSLPAMLFLLVTAVVAVRYKINASKIYIVGLCTYLVGLLVISLYSLGLLPYNALTRYGFMYGSIIEMVLFSLALSCQIKLLQDEKKLSQHKLLITEQKLNQELDSLVKQRTQDLQKANDELHRLTEDREQLTSHIVHDLKSPLAIIINLSSLDGVKNQKSLIEAAGYTMLNMVQNILDVYRAEKAGLQVHKRPILLHHLVYGAQKESELMAGGTQLKIDTARVCRCIVEADEELLQRVLSNLLSNALKHSPADGTIAISTLTETDAIRVVVHNHGPAIPQDQQSYIFERFGQLGKKTAYSSGLGLSFCKMAIEAHGGQIGVESTPGLGTSFWFTLPGAVQTETTTRY